MRTAEPLREKIRREALEIQVYLKHLDQNGLDSADVSSLAAVLIRIDLISLESVGGV